MLTSMRRSKGGVADRKHARWAGAHAGAPTYLSGRARLARALTPDDFAVVFADPDQLSLFTPPLAAMRPILTTMIEDDARS